MCARSHRAVVGLSPEDANAWLNVDDAASRLVRSDLSVCAPRAVYGHELMDITDVFRQFEWE